MDCYVINGLSYKNGSLKYSIPPAKLLYLLIL